MDVRFWGVRGSIGSPPTSAELRKKIERVLAKSNGRDMSSADSRNTFLSELSDDDIGFLGGNTPCVELSFDDKQIIFDMGTGLRLIGEKIMKDFDPKKEYEIHIFIGHTHWDHIQGFPFFIPAYRDNVTIHFYHVHPALKERLEQQQDYRFFPVSLEFMASKKQFHQLDVDSVVNIGDAVVRVTELNHPGKCYGYRVEHEGKTFIYASDGEYNYLPTSKIKKFIDFYSNADFLIFDAPFSFSEEIEKINWGHSSALVGIDLSVKAEVKKLVLFHHAPENDDDAVFNLLGTAINYKEQNYSESDLQIILAREGLYYKV